MMTRQQFYTSDTWSKFRKVIIEQRTDEDGFVRCAICGQPILKKYDLIVHHKKELDDLNVNDATVALNPDNVECVHFKCHNQIHERFGFNKTSKGGIHQPVQKHVYIVYGSPCSGKSTWVKDVATKDDLIVDMDSIWQMISINDRYDKPDALRSVVFDLRDKMYDIIKYRSGRWHNAYIIVGGALKGDRERMKARVGADDLIFIDATKEECMARVRNRFDDGDNRLKWYEYITDWFQKYQAD
jgi:hypothetical protein